MKTIKQYAIKAFRIVLSACIGITALLGLLGYVAYWIATQVYNILATGKTHNKGTTSRFSR